MTRVIALSLSQGQREDVRGIGAVDRATVPGIDASARAPSAAVTPGEECVLAGVEERWARRIRDGDAAAFESLFRGYYNRLCLHAERLIGSSDEAEEIVAEVFLRIWERRREWDVRGSLKNYLYRSIRNQALKRLEHREVRNRARSTLDRKGTTGATPSRPASPDATAEAHEFEKALDAAIAALPPRTREAFLLQRVQGLSYAEIAESMETSVFTVKNQLARALKLLRERLRPWLEGPS